MTRFLLCALVLCVVPVSGHAGSITERGVDIPLEATVDDEPLVLFGHGVARYARIFRVYVGALYGPDDVEPDELLDSDVPVRLEITYLRSVGADDIREATRVVLENQYEGDELEAVRDRFDRFNALYEDVGDGDQYAFEYRPSDEAARLYFNGEQVGEETGRDFARAYLGLWLAPEEPLSKSLREDLLDRKR